MPDSIDLSTLRVLNARGKTIGTGFLVAQNLAVTCAHVVILAGFFPGDPIGVQFTGRKEVINAIVDADHWLDQDKGDVAFLRLGTTPEEIQPLELAPGLSCPKDSEFSSPPLRQGWLWLFQRLSGKGEEYFCSKKRAKL